MISATKIPVRIALIFVVVVMLVMSSFTPTAPVRAQGCFPFYIVKPGENLYRIAVAAGTSWQVLAWINGISNPNRILVGQRICLPPVAPGVTPTPIVVVMPTVPPPAPTRTPGPTAIPGPTLTPWPSYSLPPAGVFPSITFSVRAARIGDTITIFGQNFPKGEPLDIFITNRGWAYPGVAAGAAVAGADGSLNTNFVIPANSGGVALNGPYLSVLVRGRFTGYFGFNWFTRIP